MGTENITKPNVFAIWPLAEEACRALPYAGPSPVSREGLRGLPAAVQAVLCTRGLRADIQTSSCLQGCAPRGWVPWRKGLLLIFLPRVFTFFLWVQSY